MIKKIITTNSVYTEEATKATKKILDCGFRVIRISVMRLISRTWVNLAPKKKHTKNCYGKKRFLLLTRLWLPQSQKVAALTVSGSTSRFAESGVLVGSGSGFSQRSNTDPVKIPPDLQYCRVEDLQPHISFQTTIHLPRVHATHGI